MSDKPLTAADLADREKFRQFTEAFGADDAWTYYLAGLNYEQAATKHRDARKKVAPTIENQPLADAAVRGIRRWQTNRARRDAGLPPVPAAPGTELPLTNKERYCRATRLPVE